MANPLIPPSTAGYLVGIKASDEHPSVENVLTRLAKRTPVISQDSVGGNRYKFEDREAINRVFSIDDRSRFDADLPAHPRLCRTNYISIPSIKCDVLCNVCYADFSMQGVKSTIPASFSMA